MFSDSTEHLASPRGLEARLQGRLWSKLLSGRAVKLGRILGTGFCKKGRSTCQISARRVELTGRLIAFRAVRTIVNQGSDISAGQREEASCPAVRYSSAGIDLRSRDCPEIDSLVQASKGTRLS